MQKELMIQAILKVLAGIILVGILIFVPAGTILFINGWILMGVLFIPMITAGIIMIIRNPDLLRKRLNAKENQKEQKVVILLSGLMFIAGFIVAGLDFRFGRTLPQWVSIIATALFLIAYILYAVVIRENPYLSRTIEIQDNHKVIDTGLYGIVRHPMYSSTLILFLSMPLVLGSIYSFIIFMIYPFVIVKRIKYEELLLEKELEGYTDYQKKVKYRLLPYIW